MSEAPFAPEEFAAVADPGAPVAEPQISVETPAVAVAAAPRYRRIPHFGHLALLGLFLLAGLVCSVILIFAAVHFSLFGIGRIEDAMHSLPYAVGTMLAWYLTALAPAVAIFPMLWGKSFLAGVQWNAATVRRVWPWLMATGAACFLIALGAKSVLHFPDKSPISGLLSTPTAVWVMFAFSITFAPLCEETIFRGFVLPAFATAYDWAGERITGRAPRPLLESGHPQWSWGAMIVSSIITSFFFALLHAGQIGGSLGPLELIFAVSLVLCAVRLATRSLAASTLTHATYNGTLFLLMAISTHGFRQLHG